MTALGAEPALDTAVALGRLLKPRSIAIVGPDDSHRFLPYLAPTLDSSAEVYFVNHRHRSVLGRATYPSLSDIGHPIDAVLSTMSAARTTDLAEEAADLDVGGLVVIAGAFGEMGPDGAELQLRLAAAARRGGMAVVGPNGLGYVNVPERVSLTMASPHKRRPGGLSVVSQSGAILSGVGMATWERSAIGLNLLVSAGNEAVTDLADYLDYLADDPDTSAIALVVEKVRRPAAFFAAVGKARAAGKPVAALKLARSARTQRLAASHTGALTGDAWVYDVAFRQAGIALAHDPEELVDRLAVMMQIEPSRWTATQRLGVVAMTGGYASLAFDVAAAEQLELPELPELGEWVAANLPGITIANPLDTTGLGGALWPEIVDRYASSPDLDALVFVHPLAEEDESNAVEISARFAQAGATADRPLVLSNCAGAPAQFVLDQVHGSGTVAVGHGVRSSMRGLAAMGDFVRRRDHEGEAPVVRPVARPGLATITQPEGEMLPFAAAMRLLESAGVPVAPYHLVAAGEVAAPTFDGPYVVKLADVGHRTEYGAVRLDVAAAGLAAAVAAMRVIATAHGLPDLVAVQPMLRGRGEAFVGIQGEAELGSLVVFGLGGVLVEALGRVGGRMAPLSRWDAETLIEEFTDVRVMHGFRGRPAWDLDALADLLVRLGGLAAGAQSWLASLDVNPLVVTDDGVVAVDALCLVRSPAQAG